MKPQFMLVVSLVALLVAILSGQSVVAPTYNVSVDEVPRVLSKLSASTSVPAFAVFMFTTPDRRRDEDALNIQFSIEHGHTGFDWVLLAPRNIEDKERYLKFALTLGFTPKPMEANGVKYLRVEEGDIARLCSRVITEMYGVPRTKKVEMIVEGFKW